MVLTGASRGIGHATVKLFSEAGWRIITCSRQPFDGDGRPDLLTSNDLADSVSILLNQGPSAWMGLGFARDFCKQIEQDIPIWEAKIYRDRPLLARGEGAINDFRAWARHSYEEATA